MHFCFVHARYRKSCLHLIVDIAKMSRGDLISRITADVGKIQSVFSSGILDLAGTATLLIGAIAMIAVIDFTMLAIVMIILTLVCIALFLRIGEGGVPYRTGPKKCGHIV